MNPKESYLLDAEARLLSLGHQILLLKLRIEEATPEVMGDCYHHVGQLNAQYEQLEMQLAALEEAAGEAWTDLRGGLEQGFWELTDSLESLGLYFRSQIGTNLWIPT
jgi:hypothetical protein